MQRSTAVLSKRHSAPMGELQPADKSRQIDTSACVTLAFERDWSKGVEIASGAVAPRREAKHALPGRAVRGASKEAHVMQGDALRSTRTAAHRSAGAARVVPTTQTSPRAAPPPRGPIFLRKRPQEAHHSL